MIHLSYVASRVFGTPLMIARGKLEVILGVLAPRFAGGLIQGIEPAAEPLPLTSITAEPIARCDPKDTHDKRSNPKTALEVLEQYCGVDKRTERHAAALVTWPTLITAIRSIGRLSGPVTMIDVHS